MSTELGHKFRILATVSYPDLNYSKEALWEHDPTFTGLKEAMEVGDTQAVNMLTFSEFLGASSPALNAQVVCVVQQQSSILKGG